MSIIGRIHGNRVDKTVSHLPLSSRLDMSLKCLVAAFLLSAACLFCSDYPSIMRRNLFAPAPATPKNGTGKSSPAKETLPVVKMPPLEESIDLKGTLLSTSSQEKSVAVIEDKRSKETDFYRIGDMVNSAIVKSIGESSITVEYGFQEFEVTTRGIFPLRVYPDSEYDVSLEESILELGKEISSGSGLKAVPAIENGSVSGYMVTGIGAGSILEKLGIKNNDIITRINTISLDSPEKPLYAYETVMKYAIRRVTVHVLRENLPYTLLYRIQ